MMTYQNFYDLLIFIIVVAFLVYYYFLLTKKNRKVIDTSGYYIGLYHKSNKKDFKYTELLVNDNNDNYSLFFNYGDVKFKCTDFNASVYDEKDSNRNMKFLYNLLDASADKKRISVTVSEKSKGIIYKLKDE